MIRRSALWPHVYLRSNALRVTIASDGRNMDRVSADGRLDLMGAGFELPVPLRERPRRVLSRDQRLDLTRDRAPAPFERSIDVLFSRLRRKMELDPREAVRVKSMQSGGYRFSPEVKSV
jgi:two-component system OmpR family response regulator